MSERLDPCPVCGAAVTHVAGLEEGWILCPDGVGHEYEAEVEQHRRLCAEVALARVVMALDDDTSARLVVLDSSGLRMFDNYALLAGAIARVREASK